MLHAARRQAPVTLARCMLGLGVSATVGANVLYGLPSGVIGAIVSAWPAVAFIGSAEMALGMVRSAARPAPAPEVDPAAPATAPANGDGAPEGGREAADVFADALAGGQVPSVREIRRVMHLGQPRAQEVRAYLTALAVRT